MRRAQPRCPAEAEAAALDDDGAAARDLSVEIARAQLALGRDRADAVHRLTAAHAGNAAQTPPSTARLAGVATLLATSGRLIGSLAGSWRGHGLIA